MHMNRCVLKKKKKNGITDAFSLKLFFQPLIEFCKCQGGSIARGIFPHSLPPFHPTVSRHMWQKYLPAAGSCALDL